MRNHAMPVIEHLIGGMHSLLGRTPSDGAGIARSSGGGCPVVAHESPVHFLRPEDALSARSSRSRSSRVADVSINYMVLGESGLGKSSFVHNLASGFKVAEPGSTIVEGATTMRQFKADPSSLRTVLAPLDLPECGMRLQISIQDMPGWGEDLNLRRYLRTIIAFLLTRREMDYHMLGGSGCGPQAAEQGEGSSSSSSAHLQLWHSITACLYFLPPHRVKQADLAIMSAVSQLVTVIPIISKSDSMTDAELAVYRQEVLQLLQQPAQAHASPHGKDCSSSSSRGAALQDLPVRTFPVEPSVLKLLGLQQLPLAVNCSRHREACSDEDLLSLTGPQGQHQAVQPVRQYSWGAVYPLYRQHNSDLIPLKRLLLGDQAGALLALHGDSHKRFLQFCVEYEDYEEELQALVQEMWCLVRPLEYDDYTAVKSNLKAVQAAKRVLLKDNRALAEKLARTEAEVKQMKERCWR